MNDNYNPDYPVANGGSFLDHSYLQQQNVPSSSFYYAGMGASPFAPQPTYYPDSRRNDGVQNGVPQQPVPTQSPVMPFSSYPPTGPQPNQPAFNSLAESRRFDQQPASVGSNPWANPQPQPQFAAPINPQPAIQNPWSYQPQMSSYVDPNCMALYTNPNFGFDKSNGSWDNLYTTQRPVEAPVINWNQPTVPQPVYQQPTYPAFNYNYPQTTMSWNDIAEKNWGKSSL